ncbi:hypothetical protein ACHAXT_006720 [Thalassiosira profunda]
MKTPIVLSLLLGAAVAFAPAPRPTSGSATRVQEKKADLEDLAEKLNPAVGFFDPMDLANGAFWNTNEEFTVGFLRHAEIKHGRVAMAAFVGYCVQSVWKFPWPMTLAGEPFPSLALSPPEQWDALPFASKMQIVLFIGFLEWYSELTPSEGSEAGLPHYCKGGVPGKYPTFDAIPHPMPFRRLYDPFGFQELSKFKMSKETKERRLRTEINNGRLAMLGIFGFLCEQTIPGSVPLLKDVVAPYSGEVMAPFSGDFSIVLPWM